MRNLKPITAQLALYLGTLAACLALATIPACGASQRTKTIQASLTAVNAARDGFIAFDRKTEHDIVEKATSRIEVEAEIAAYRAKSSMVWQALGIAYDALLVATNQSDDPSLKKALEETHKLVEAIQKLTGGT